MSAFHIRPAPLSRLPSQLRRAVATRQFASSAFLRRVFGEGDVVVLREKNRHGDGALVKLGHGKAFQSHRGAVQHADIIGKQQRQTVHSTKGTVFRLHEPTLSEYVRLTPRLVTPIYPQDANLIVSLFDLNVDTFDPTTVNAPRLEILEAGTGHGALSLHLSRAIHAANSAPPRSAASPVSADSPEDDVCLGESASDLHETAMEAWKASRRAVVHTIDVKRTYSKHAKKIVEGFAHGMYARNVDFHVGDVSEWIASQKIVRNTDEPYLSHVFLDLPNPHHHIANVAPALHVNGLLAVFSPSITQIVEVVELIRKHKLPYLLDQVVELGLGNVRQWDVRSVRPRATLKEGEKRTKDVMESDPKPESAAETEPEDVVRKTLKGQEARDLELAEALAKDKEEQWAMVCRPKVGDTVIGGGFLGLWRRMEPAAETSVAETATPETAETPEA